MNVLEELKSLVPPPANPSLNAGNWETLYEALGTKLPDDFVALISDYGAGRFFIFLHPFSPFSEERPMHKMVKEALWAEREIKTSFPEDFPFPLHPEPGGLLPWAVTDNGDRVFWKTEGAPNAWTIVVWESRGPLFEVYEESATSFLLRCAKGELRSEIMPPYHLPEAQPFRFFDAYRKSAFFTFHFTESKRDFHERAEVVKALLAPTEGRGRAISDDGKVQEHFMATSSNWEVTYENMYGHGLRLQVPIDERNIAKDKANQIAQALGVRVKHVYAPDD